MDILCGRAEKEDFGKRSVDIYFEWKTFVPKCQESIENGKELTIYLSEKANGENA